MRGGNMARKHGSLAYVGEHVPTSDLLEKKMRKRLQLKNLILTKFRNKYSVLMSSDDDINTFIQKEVDQLFALELFDERDLVQVDRNIRAQIDKSNEHTLQKSKTPLINRNSNGNDVRSQDDLFKTA